MNRTLLVSAVICVALTQTLHSNAQSDQALQDELPSSAYWMNSAFEFSMQTFNNKILLVDLWHPASLEGRIITQRLEEFAIRYPQFQLVSIIPGDTALPFSRNDLYQIVRENKLHHPVGIAKDLSSFKSLKNPEYPTVLMYEGTNKASRRVSGIAGVDSLFAELEKKVSNTVALEKLDTWQVLPEFDQGYWAVPIIECPSYIEADGPALYVVESAQNKITLLDKDGNYTDYAGGLQGYMDGALHEARFFNPGGLAYHSSTGELYVADTDNNRIRLVSFESGFVTTFAGNGLLPSPKKPESDTEIAWPTDLIFDGGKLLVLSGYSNELLELDGTTGKIKKRLKLFKEYHSGGSRVYPKNISAGSKGLNVVLSDGSILQVDKKNVITKLYKPTSLKDAVGAVAEKGGKLYVTLPYRNEIAYLEEEKLILVAGGSSGFIDNQAEKAAFQFPFDLAESGGDLIVTDKNNNALRIVSTGSGKSTHIRPDPMSITMNFEDSPDKIESVAIGPLIVGKGRNDVQLKFDLGEYTLASDGRNDFTEIEEYGMDFESEGLSNKGLNFSFTPVATNGYIQVVMHLTLEKTKTPEQIIFKSTFLYIEYEVIEGEENSQPVEYKPKLRPF